MLKQQTEIDFYYNVWKQIVIPFSNAIYYDLKPNYQKILNKVINDLNIPFDRSKSISFQLDKPIINKIIKLAIDNNDETIVDIIYKRTRSSMFRYFHYEDIITAYINFGKIDKAINVLKYILNKNHCSYWYAIYNYSEINDNNEFIEQLLQLKYFASIKLLAVGESINLNDITFEKLENILNDIKKIKSEL